MEARINLSNLKDYYFSKAENFFIWTFRIKIILTLVNMVLIVALPGSDALSNWITVFIILSVSTLDFVLDWFYSKNKEKAEKLREFEFNQVNLHLEPDSRDLSEFYLEIPRKFRSGDKSLNPKFNENYFENENIRFNLLENIYLTSQNFKHNLNFYIRVLIVVGLIVVLFLFGFFILYTFEKYPFSWECNLNCVSC